jgi:rhomboid protease GluP
MTARIPARSKRQAMDWSLALISQGIESTIDYSEAGWGLIVESEEQDRALGTIRQYRVENFRWHWRQEIRPEVHFDWASLAWVLLICLFYRLETGTSSLHDAGLMDSAAVSRGEWWRLFTAIFLHADPAHLAANATFGLLLLGLAMGHYGTGVALLAAYLAGAAGNAAAWIFLKIHLSLGASGMVMGCLGLLTAQSFALLRNNPSAVKYLLGGVAGGVMLFVLMGLDPGSDVLAHFGGFLTGLLLGSILTLWPRLAQNTVANLLAGILFCLLVTFTWWLAIAKAG